MKQQARLIQYTVRGIPPEVDKSLRRKAARNKRSLNEQIIEELTAAAGGTRMYEDFSDLTGRWTPDPQFDEVIASQRRIDREKWK